MNSCFLFCGNVRTFLNCFDSCEINIISKLFNTNTNIHLFFYLKLDDPGPKIGTGCEYTYLKSNYNDIFDKINNITKYKCFIKILNTNEETDENLKSLVKDRNKYIGRHLGSELEYIRALHQYYNFEKCYEFITKIELEYNIKYDYSVFIRPDLYFTKKCKNINEYIKNKVIIGKGPYPNVNDHLSIIPRRFFKHFFLDRMELLRTNDTEFFSVTEEIYRRTIPYYEDEIGNYYIKRE